MSRRKKQKRKPTRPRKRRGAIRRFDCVFGLEGDFSPEILRAVLIGDQRIPRTLVEGTPYRSLTPQEVHEPFALLTPSDIKVTVPNGKAHLDQPWLGVYREAGFITQRQLDSYVGGDEYDVDAIIAAWSRRRDLEVDRVRPSLWYGAFALVRNAGTDQTPETNFHVESFRSGGMKHWRCPDRGNRVIDIDPRADLPAYCGPESASWPADLNSNELSLGFYVNTLETVGEHGWVTLPVRRDDQVFLVFFDEAEKGVVLPDTKAGILADDGPLEFLRRAKPSDLCPSEMWNEAAAALRWFDPTAGVLVVILTPAATVKCKVILLPIRHSVL